MLANHETAKLERDARCPACTQTVAGLIVRLDGKLRCKDGGVELLGFVCPHCLHAIHWGNRSSKRPKIRI